MKRATYQIFAKGKVQGVGFRATTQRLAIALELKGFVQNLENGDVLIVVEGKERLIQSLLSQLRELFIIEDFLIEPISSCHFSSAFEIS